MTHSLQDEVCQFVREIIAARAGEPISIASRPDRDHRNDKAVEELWDAPSAGYAVEHTRVESFDGNSRTSQKYNGSCRP